MYDGLISCTVEAVALQVVDELVVPVHVDLDLSGLIIIRHRLDGQITRTLFRKFNNFVFFGNDYRFYTFYRWLNEPPFNGLKNSHVTLVE
ncbi:hypothetical protein D3C73_1505710 [compost metagenome]